MTNLPVKFYPPSDVVRCLNEMSANLSLSRSQLMSVILFSFLERDYENLDLLHNLNTTN